LSFHLAKQHTNKDRQQGRGEGDKDRQTQGSERKEVVVEDTFLIQAALFLTLLIWILCTDLVQISQNYETILKTYNFAQQTLKRKKYGGFSYAFRHFECL
jgi:hypothetical protein